MLDGDETSSFPDTGAPANFISKSYVDRHKIKYDMALKQVFKNGIGTKIKTLGTVMLLFSFKGESESHFLLFHVRPESAKRRRPRRAIPQPYQDVFSLQTSDHSHIALHTGTSSLLYGRISPTHPRLSRRCLRRRTV